MLPILYKKTKTGAIQTYQVTTNNEVITVTQGQLGGKKQSYTTVCEGKNIGKSNETSPSEQALLEAASKHTKKLKSGYVIDTSGELQVKLPQKVHPYLGNEHKISYPAYSTPKLNGVNGTYWLQDDGSLLLTSRGGDPYSAIPHLEPSIHKLMKQLDTTCLNGELYIHGEHLQDITSAVKKPKPLSAQLVFGVFEAPFIAPIYSERREILKAISNPPHVIILTGIEVETAVDIDNHFDSCIEAGYEGTVIYNADAPYEFNTRSSYVFKYKKPQDGEYKILSYNVDKNDHPVFICETKLGATFKVKPKGTSEKRKEIITQFDTLYKNQFYKIEYETLSKDDIPLKPVGICLRKCDSEGNPLE